MGKPVAHQVHETDGGGVWKTGVCAGAGGMCCDAGAETRGVWHALSGGIVARLFTMSMCRTNDKLASGAGGVGRRDGARNEHHARD